MRCIGQWPLREAAAARQQEAADITDSPSVSASQYSEHTPLLSDKH